MRDLVDEFNASGIQGAPLDIVLECYGCPICGESDHDNLVNRDGIVHCATCGHDYDLEPEREEASNA
jgi:hypothetical protein